MMLFTQIRDDAERIHAKNLPMLSALTQNDCILEWELPVELARHCGAIDEQITYFDENKQVVCGPETGLCVTVWVTLSRHNHTSATAQFILCLTKGKVTRGRKRLQMLSDVISKSYEELERG